LRVFISQPFWVLFAKQTLRGFARFPLAILSGWLFFHEHFSWSTLAGGGLIIASYF
jgi:drug/metabolite transporter (DMT)-like permease